MQAPDPETHAPTLVWTDEDGAVRYGTADRDDPYRPGERARVLEYSTFTCWTWETYDDRRDDLIGMVLFLFAIPGAAIMRLPRPPAAGDGSVSCARRGRPGPRGACWRRTGSVTGPA